MKIELVSLFNDLGADEFEIVEISLKELEVLLEVHESHVHQVDKILLVFWTVFLRIHHGHVGDLLKFNVVNY